jgi:hypothetical protein
MHEKIGVRHGRSAIGDASHKWFLSKAPGYVDAAAASSGEVETAFESDGKGASTTGGSL